MCARSFLHRETGALIEVFDADLNPIDGEEGEVVEPGHCFEWAWLFERLAQWGFPEATRISDGLVGFGRRHGLDAERGVAVNEIRTDGSVRNPSARLWPQTERLKAALARHRRTGEAEERQEAAAAYASLVQYLDTPARGAWRDKLKADGALGRRACARQLPLPYHLRHGGTDRGRQAEEDGSGREREGDGGALTEAAAGRAEARPHDGGHMTGP